MWHFTVKYENCVHLVLKNETHFLFLLSHLGLRIILLPNFLSLLHGPAKNPKKKKRKKEEEKNKNEEKDRAPARVLLQLELSRKNFLSYVSSFLFWVYFSSIFTSGYTDSGVIRADIKSGFSRRGCALFSLACDDQLPAN